MTRPTPATASGKSFSDGAALRRVLAVARDFAVALAFFLAIAAVIELSEPAAGPGYAAVLKIGLASVSAADLVYPTAPPTIGHSAVLAGFIGLGLAFATIVAFNSWIYRHLRRVNASPRQGAWRGSRKPISGL